MLGALNTHGYLPGVTIEPTVLCNRQTARFATGRQREDPEFERDAARIDPAVDVPPVQFGSR